MNTRENQNNVHEKLRQQNNQWFDTKVRGLDKEQDWEDFTKELFQDYEDRREKLNTMTAVELEQKFINDYKSQEGIPFDVKMDLDDVFLDEGRITQSQWNKRKKRKDK